MQGPHYYSCHTDLPVNRPLYSLSLVNKIKVPKLLYLGKDLLPDLEKVLYLFPVENRSLRFGCADSHPGRFTLGCEPIQ